MVNHLRDDDARSHTRPPESLLAAVESLVAELRGSGLGLSPHDVARVRHWQTLRAPDRVVLGALREAYTTLRTAPPRSLRFAEAQVEQAIARHHRLQVGASPEPLVTGTTSAVDFDPLRARIESLERLLAEVSEPRVRLALRGAKERLEALGADAGWSAWRTVRAELLVALEGALSEDERAALRREVHPTERFPMSDEAKAAHHSALRETWLARRFGLQYLLG